jgi:cytochrome c554/c'-like protein
MHAADSQEGSLPPGPSSAPALLSFVLASTILTACQRPPVVAFSVAPVRVEGEPDRLAVTMRIERVPSRGLELRGFTTTDVLRIADLSAAGADGAALPTETGIQSATFNNRTLDIPRVVLHGPLPSTVVVRYTVRTGLREGDSHMGFTGRCHGYVGKEFGFTIGRDIFLLPEPAERIDDLSVRFDLPPEWVTQAPWAGPGGIFRPGVGGRFAAEHLVSAAVGFGRFRERAFELGGTRYRLAFEADITAADEDRVASRLETVVRYVHGLFGRDLGPEYLVLVMPKAPTGDEIAGEGWGTGQGETLAPLTADRLHTFALSLIEAYVRHAPYRSEISRPDEYWLVDGVKQLYAWRAVATAGLMPEDEVTRSLAVAYLTSIGVMGVEPDLEKIYATPGAHRIETESRAPFVLAHLDHELRAASAGSETLDALLPRVFGRSPAPSFWSTVPEVRPDFRSEFRARYVRGKEIIPLGEAYTLTPTRPRPDPPGGPVTRRLTFLFTGDTQGYLENCGCKVNQSGGVARRSTALAKLRKDDPEALVLDAGSAFVRPEKQLELDFLTREEQALYLGTLDTMRYQAAAIGTTELTFGLDYFRQQTHGLRVPFLAANIKRAGVPIAPASIVLPARGVRVGVIGVFEPPYGKSATALFEENTQALTFEDPIDTLRREAPLLRKKADLVVALGRLTPYTIRAVASSVPDLDAVISSEYRAPAKIGGAEDHIHPEDQPGFIGRMLVAYSSLTNYGLSSVQAGLDAQGRIVGAEFRDHWLYDDTPDDPRVRATLDRFYDRIGRMAAAQDAVSPLFADDLERRNGEYVGAAKCAECHAAEMAQWRRTKHASAYKTLLDRHRHFQPKCVVCHVVGYGTPHGYRLGMPETLLANVQCEVCHGAGGAHAASPAKDNIRRAVPAKVCLECHTPDHSDHFVYEERLTRVKHDYFEQ